MTQNLNHAALGSGWRLGKKRLPKTTEVNHPDLPPLYHQEVKNFSCCRLRFLTGTQRGITTKIHSKEAWEHQPEFEMWTQISQCEWDLQTPGCVLVCMSHPRWPAWLSALCSAVRSVSPDRALSPCGKLESERGEKKKKHTHNNNKVHQYVND